MPAAARTVSNFPGGCKKRMSIALRARRAQHSVYITLLVGSYFGSQMKSFNPKLGNKAERQAFVKSKIPILLPQTTEPPAVAPPEPQGVPSLAAGPPLAQAPPPLAAPTEGGFGPPPRHPPQESHASTSTAHKPSHALYQHPQPWRSARRASAHPPVLTIPTAPTQTFMQNFNTLSPESQRALMQGLRHPHAVTCLWRHPPQGGQTF